MNNDSFAHRRGFYLLKKYGSYTWRNEIFRLTKQFAEEFEQILRNPPPSFQPVNEMDEIFLSICWQACSHMEEGLNLILQGDKSLGYDKFADGSTQTVDLLSGDPDRGSPRRYIEAPGQDAKYVAIGYLRSLGNDPQYQQMRINTGCFYLLDQVRLMVSYTSLFSHIESIANKVWPRPLDSDLRQAKVQIPRWHPSILPPVPAPVPDAPVIVSGDEVPITGIWQPEPLKPLDAKMLQLIDGTQPYCMNRLVQGRTAPEMVPESAYELWEKTRNGRLYGNEYPVRWRLLWVDDRYGDNGIPDEEKDYLRTDPPPADPVSDSRLRGLPDEVVPQTGYWWTPALIGPQGMRHFRQGDHFPAAASSEYGAVIWYYDPERQTPTVPHRE